MLGTARDRGLAAVARRSSSTSARATGVRLRRRGRRSRRGWSPSCEASPLPAGTLLNINVPGGEPTGVEVARLGKRVYRDELALVEEDEARPPPVPRSTARQPPRTTRRGTDLAAVAQGKIAVTPLHFDLTDHDGRRGAAALRPGAAARAAGRASEHERRARRSRLRPSAPPSCASCSTTTATATTSSTTRRSATTEYDALLDELRAIEADHPELVTPDSPTQRVGGEPVSELVKVRHPQRDAVAGQRPLGRRAAGLDPADAQPPRARGDRGSGVRVRRRAEDRRPGDLADLPRRRARARRHPRQRRDRRGRHPQPAHDRLDPAAARHGRPAAAARGARRGLHVAAGLRRRSTSAAPRPGCRRS